MDPAVSVPSCSPNNPGLPSTLPLPPQKRAHYKSTDWVWLGIRSLGPQEVKSILSHYSLHGSVGIWTQAVGLFKGFKLTHNPLVSLIRIPIIHCWTSLEYPKSSAVPHWSSHNPQLSLITVSIEAKDLSIYLNFSFFQGPTHLPYSAEGQHAS